ncbi:hypothetical protein GCM10022280_06300 [Sphingomonas swuensis]|uniref:YaiO beta-barrel domain-containing protein n=1 Tax=Sphingomonas swuensis TaxID=977800 RepID=A0ABP7SGP3_9SPHN
MRAFIGLLAATLITAPAWSQEPPSTVSRAVAARQSGDARGAITLLEQWLATRPDDVDARLQLGLAQLDLGQLAEARRSFEQVLATAPDYRDARLGLARVAERSGKPAEATAILAPLPATDADAAAIRARLVLTGDKPWRVDLDGGLSAVEGGQPDWRELSLQLRHDAGTAVAARVEATRRFGLDDVYGQLEVEQRLSPDLSVSFLAGGTPDADYRPSWQLGAGARLRLQSGPTPTIATLDLRRASFRSGKVTVARPGFEQYLAGGRVWLTGQLILLSDGARTKSGVLGRVDGEIRPGLRLYAGAANAPDTSEGVVSRVRSLFGGVEAAIGSERFVRLTVARHDQQLGSDRTDLMAGVGARF